MIKFMFQNYVKGKADITVDSAGLIHHTKSVNENTISVLKQNDVPFVDSKSKFCSKEVFNSSNYLFTMSDEISNELEKLYGKDKKIVCLSKFLGKEVFDPYKQGREAYETVFDMFDKISKDIYQFVK